MPVLQTKAEPCRGHLSQEPPEVPAQQQSPRGSPSLGAAGRKLTALLGQVLSQAPTLSLLLTRCCGRDHGPRNMECWPLGPWNVMSLSRGITGVVEMK